MGKTSLTLELLEALRQRHFASNPRLAPAFVDACVEWRR
jgi:hypothetical protein